MLSKLLLLAPVSVAAGLPTLLTEWDLPHAAVAFATPKFGGLGPALTLTTFSPKGTDAVWVVDNLAGILNKSATPKMRMVENTTQWPNMAEVSEDGSQMLTACGFFVSGAKSTGSIDLYDVSEFPLRTGHAKISEDRKANFYHRAMFMDVDKDGVMDVVAARAFKSMNPLSKAEGEMMWFKNNNGAWETKYLTKPQGDGPDVSFTIVDLDGDGKEEFVATMFFTQQALVIWECTKDKWSACENGDGVVQHKIDDIGSAWFNVQSVDLNGDGQKELLATTNTADGTGAVYAFEVVGDFRKGPDAFVKHTLATGYKPKSSILPGQGSPGSAYAFKVKDTDAKPSIIVSADDGGWFDMLTPTSLDAKDWSYSQDRLVTTSGTVGTPSNPIAVDGSGKKVMFLPLYHEGKVQMYVFE